jgi:Tfp pilus assembly protein PilN
MSSALELNLSRSPFVNRRPVRRLAATLWVAGVALLAVNVLLIWSHRSGNVEKRVELAQIRATAAREVELARLLRDELSSMGLAAQNKHVDFLNQRIAQRAFPWSLLFEQLVEVMPRGVRLRSLSPGIGQGGGREGRTRRTVLDRRVRLSISAQAESGEAILDFVERLFAHPAFDGPNLQRESKDGAVIGFQLDVLYQPELESPAPEQTARDHESEPGSTERAAEPATPTSREAPPSTSGARAVRASGGGAR